MKNLKIALWFTASLFGALRAADQKIWIPTKVQNIIFPSWVSEKDTYQTIIDQCKKHTQFKADIKYTLFIVEISKDPINLKALCDINTLKNKVNTLHIITKREWPIVPKGTLLPAEIRLSIDTGNYSTIADVKETIRTFITHNNLTHENYYSIKISKNGSVLSDSDRMPAYGEPFDSTLYEVTLDKVEVNPHLKYIVETIEEPPFVDATLQNVPKSWQLQSSKSSVALNTAEGLQIIARLKGPFEIHLLEAEKGTERVTIANPQNYFCYQKLTYIIQQQHYESDNFNNTVTLHKYNLLKQLLALWANNSDYTFFEDGQPVPIWTQTMEIEGHSNRTTYGAFVRLDLNKSPDGVIEEIYRKQNNLAPDISIKIKEKEATLNRKWHGSLKGTISTGTPFSVDIEDGETIGSVKRKIETPIETSNLISRPFIVTITKNGQPLRDDDIMPYYTEKFDGSLYEVALKFYDASPYEISDLSTPQRSREDSPTARNPTTLTSLTPQRNLSLLQRLRSGAIWSDLFQQKKNLIYGALGVTIGGGLAALWLWSQKSRTGLPSSVGTSKFTAQPKTSSSWFKGPKIKS